MALKFRRGTTAQKSGSLAFGEPYVNTTLGTLQVGGPDGDITLSINSASAGISGSSLDITGNAKIDGNLSLGGQLTIGDNTSDTVNVVASLSSSLIPQTTNVFDLGSPTKIWKDLYISTGSIKMYDAAGNLISTVSSNADGSQTFSGLIRANAGVFIPNSIQVSGTGGLGIGAYGDRLMLGTSGSAGAGQQSLIFTPDGTNSYTFPNATGTIALTSDLTSGTTSVSNLNTFSGSTIGRLNNLETTSASLLIQTSNLEGFTSSINTTIKNKLDVESVISGSSQLTSSYDNRYVTLESDQTISGTKTFNNINVNGTGSFAYIESTTGSAKIIGDSFIVLNNNTPTSRYAGMSVYDSGSTLSTASFYYDGQTNDWGYEYSSSTGVDYAVTIFGPEYSTKGSPTYLTTNKVPKSVDNHHLNDSNIFDDGTTISLGTNVVVTGSVTATSFVGSISATNGVVSGSSQVTLSSTTGGGTSADVQFGSLGIGMAASGVSGEIKATGDIIAFASSDNRLKENIKPIENALDKVSKISGNTYDWKTGFEDIHSHTGEDVGVIAQEIEAVLPQLVTTREHGYKAVQYEKLTALLIEAIKEQQTQIHNLTLEVEKLKEQKGL